MASFSESALNNVRTKDLGQVGDTLSSLVIMTTGFTSGFSGSAAGASGSAPRVRVGVSTLAASAFRVSSGIMPSQTTKNADGTDIKLEL